MGETPLTMREAARVRVVEELALRGWNAVDLARAAQIDVVTVSTFLSGERWPRRATRSKIESAVGMAPGSLGLLTADNVEVHETGRKLTKNSCDFLTGTERNQIKAAGDAAMNAAAREIMSSDSYMRRSRTIAEIALVVNDLRVAVEHPDEPWLAEYADVLRDILCIADGLAYWTTNGATERLTDAFVNDARPMLEAAEALLAVLVVPGEDVTLETLVELERSLTRHMRMLFYLATPGVPDRIIPTKPE